MTGRLFDSYLIVDWSARSTPSPARPSADAIWWALARDGQAARPVYERTRHAAMNSIRAAILAERKAGRRVLCGFDFPFGYPRGVAKRLTGKADARSLWSWLETQVTDAPDNANNRYDVASRINRLFKGAGPFWGRPDSWDHPDIPTRFQDRCGADHPPNKRIAEAHATTAKTLWQLAYAGSVGSQALLGIPALARLCADPDLQGQAEVWPLDTGLARPTADVVIAEVYPSLFQPDPREDIKDAGQVRAVADGLRTLDSAGKLGAFFEGPPGLSDDERQTIAREEAWILGLGFADDITALPHSYERDPKRIYAQSFATIRAEVDLSAFASDAEAMVIRLIHACGMTDVARDLRIHPSCIAAGQAALQAGAPILCDSQMVAHGVIARALPQNNAVITTIADPAVPAHAAEIGNTRSAAATELWADRIEGAVVAIGNAPTALFHLLDLLKRGWPKPAVILGFPVGFVGAAESKAALAADPGGVPFATVHGRRGGSAMAAAAVNALTLGLRGDGR